MAPPHSSRTTLLGTAAIAAGAVLALGGLYLLGRTAAAGRDAAITRLYLRSLVLFAGLFLLGCGVGLQNAP